MSWKDKTWDILIDRLLLVVLVGILLAVVDWRFTTLQKRADARAAVSTVMTEALVHQSKKLMTAVEEYMLLIDEMMEKGQTSNTILPRLEQQVRLAVRIFAAVSPDVDDAAEELEKSMSKLSNFVRGDRQTSGVTPLKRHGELRQDFLNRYVKFTANMRSITQQAVEIELQDEPARLDMERLSSVDKE